MKNTILLYTVFFSVATYAQHFNHDKFSKLLQSHVSENGEVDYKAIKANPEALDSYLAEFSKTHPDQSWTKNETLAYWINAYNAFTIKLIIDHYPVKSIKDIKDPCDQKFIPINGKMLSLNYIEHDVLRKWASPVFILQLFALPFSCPKLQNEAFTAENMDNQLTQATKEFLNDPQRNQITENKLALSKIFQWFSKDFKQDGSLVDFINKYTSTEISRKSRISFKDYNWALNE